MRTKDILLNDFENIKILLQYLYMDEDNYIVVNNSLTDLKITMNEQCELFIQNMNFSGTPVMKVEAEITFLFGCIEQLIKTKAQNFPDKFSSRWEEIETITRSTLALNRGI